MLLINKATREQGGFYVLGQKIIIKDLFISHIYIMHNIH